jgi:ATP-dependent DNA helicase RecG
MVSGVPEFDTRWNQLTFTHPELERIEDDDAERIASGAILATYPLSQQLRSAGLTMRLLRSMVDQVLEGALANVEEVLPQELVRTRQLLDRKQAYHYLHQPPTIEQANEARRRLKFEELFYFQLTMAQRHADHRRPQNGVPMVAKSPAARALVERLPFQLTPAQRRVIHEIVADMTSGSPMNRLLQGDVGSGKTIVALLCMLNAVDNGCQAVIMAPTEILAEQHWRGISKWLEGSGVVVEQLVGGQNRRARKESLERISSGQAHIIVGTHALFEAEVNYHKLGLVVIDEQHRFGVAQRAELQKLGRQSHLDADVVPHVLVMSATPIPRTLAMSVYGELDVSVIDQLPADRKPIRTKVVFESHLDQAFEFIRSQVREGRQAYIVYPLVEKSEKLELKSAVEHHEHLAREVFPDLRVGLLHGQMLWYEKEDVMKEFLRRELDVLVATTVVEVGVDVSNATVMLVENAERFGLAQLHQLRGRVGRGSQQSFCLLATKDHFAYQLRSNQAPNERAKSVVRLRTMEETTDGFKIAEVDLELRGPGDVLGTRQSGLPEFTYANIVADAELLTQARADAFALLNTDPTLEKPQHQQVRQHLAALRSAGTFESVA